MDTIGGHITPLSLENRRSLFVELAKRGKQRVGGEALSPFTLPRKVNGVTTPFDADYTVT